MIHRLCVTTPIWTSKVSHHPFFKIAQAIIMVWESTLMWLILNLAFYSALRSCVKLKSRAGWRVTRFKRSKRLTTREQHSFCCIYCLAEDISVNAAPYSRHSKTSVEQDSSLLWRFLLCCLITVIFVIIVNNAPVGFIAHTFARFSVLECDWDSKGREMLKLQVACSLKMLNFEQVLLFSCVSSEERIEFPWLRASVPLRRGE